MCGLTGFWDDSPGSSEERTALAREMAEAIRHRGPDDHGVWQDGPIVFAHRRLAVIGLGPEGHQPMASRDGRWMLAYNGEIYNHASLRAALLADGMPPMRGHADTEVLVEALAQWGIERTLDRIEGMFAFAAWDRHSRELILAVDRFGEKPLYHGWAGRSFVFASDLAAIECHPRFEGRPDPGALDALLRLGYVPAPMCIHEGFAKLPPGHWLRVGEARLRARHSPEPQGFWSAADTARRAAARPPPTDAEAVDRLQALLAESVAQRLEADVPVGAFMSAGLDSTTLVAVARRVLQRPVDTFTVGFDDPQAGLVGSEARDASDIARHLGTRHTEVHVTANDLLALIPELPGAYREPFADSSQLPTMLVSRAARRHVTVALSGDGADELFAGYSRHLTIPRLGDMVARVPVTARRVAARALLAVPATHLDRWYVNAARLAGRRPAVRETGDKLHKLARALQAADARALYAGVTTHWPADAHLLANAPAPGDPTGPAWEANPFADPLAWMLLQDTLTYLPGDILTKVDRAAMWTSLETRAPYLTRPIFEFAWSLRPDQRVRQGRGKWVLREVLRRHVPDSLIDRPKAGFGLPLDVWLRGELREWAEALLAPPRLERLGLRPEPVLAAWSTHLRGQQNLVQRLWPILMLSQWQDQSAMR